MCIGNSETMHCGILINMPYYLVFKQSSNTLNYSVWSHCINVEYTTTLVLIADSILFLSTGAYITSLLIGVICARICIDDYYLLGCELSIPMNISGSRMKPVPRLDHKTDFDIEHLSVRINSASSLQNGLHPLHYACYWKLCCIIISWYDSEWCRCFV